MTHNDFEPDWMSAPGATIAQLLAQKKMSLAKFGKLMKLPQTRAEKLLRGQSAITKDIALLLEEHVGGAANFWLVREKQYRDELARHSSMGSKAALRLWLNELPFADMAKMGWVKKTTALEEKAEECFKFFEVGSINSWRKQYGDVLSAVAFRTSPTFESEPGAVLAWLRYAEIQASKIDCKDWNKKKFVSILPEIRKLTRRREPSEFIPELIKLCAECGVAVVVAQSPTGCRASGATKFLSAIKALIVLSFRYRSDDQFWFSFFHEAGHLILHDSTALFIEDGSEVTEDEEKQADSFAEEVLLPGELRSQLQRIPLDKYSIVRFAVKAGISRGVVVGQLQNMNRLGHDKMNSLKRRYDRSEISI